MLRELKNAKTLCQSRSDGTLLTVSFNLRLIEDGNSSITQSCVRRLKSAVNRVSSLRDWLGQVA